ncbi:calcium/sodium antiporter [Marinomonas mediterranea]|jgi:K+-dependent Na+/Ca+ exchanger related-protein|uniref:Na+/Ca+ antiporter, CaCA family n=1 Tax=Marinomonas mediterranea (strain ATCC 700492 / JCM 21426 / NBRC 103028 / MMB-1) TaxID=717774 RepID=F2K1A4_MARM1|nr:calcium/sodium antiporter [Marinomonas mediterranea]ADZ91035.1 Na+/Ca+ antiporter, CaCA family [Marinomonas mediterranea MMB-1]WCN09072.1 calcium/sodium antiporter [Marinomonas mediterranea]WCN13103.1 calcium/sodium antiporter [Marinomonas mediterranea]WCN17174.1 calcium/sodium antiporter [Marinomonas mediterranea MMB-1]
MFLFAAALVTGLILLVLSSDKFIEHAALVAEKLNVSPIIIGVTLVALGTSAPEMVVSATAALDNAPGIAIGNVLGSNIANVALVLGATLFFSSIPIAGTLVKKEIPLVVAITLIAGALFYDGHLSKVDGLILIASFVIALIILLKGTKDGEDELTEDLPEDDGKSVWYSLLMATLGLAVLIISSKILVWGAVGIATLMGISELVIGLTIVAIGTSLPELAASITSVKKGHHDIAIGNVLGSNLFNLATVLPMPAILAPGLLNEEVLNRDYWWVLGLTLTLTLLVLVYSRTRSKEVPRWIGFPLLGSYAIYLYTLIAYS